MESTTSQTEVSGPGVPMICKKTILAKCIVQDAHVALGHGRDVLQVLSYIQAKFFIPGVRRMITDQKKSCPGCIKLNKKSYTAFEANVPDVLKTTQPLFSFCQVDIFGPILAHQGSLKLKRWVIVVLCLSSNASIWRSFTTTVLKVSPGGSGERSPLEVNLGSYGLTPAQHRQGGQGPDRHRDEGDLLPQPQIRPH